jgi:hypothetical protein
MHLGGSMEYQFATMSSKQMMRDFARVASLPPTEAIVALWGLVLPWYLGGGTAL